MSLKRLVLVCALPSFLAGCSEFYGSQPPAPVYGGEQGTVRSAPSSSQKTAKTYGKPSKQVVKTQPLKEFSEVKPEPIPLPLPAPVPLESAPLESTPLETSEPSSLPSPPAPSSTVEARPAESLPVPPPPPPVELTPFEPIEATVRLSPAVGALVSVAKQNSKSGDLDSAAASIERAIRIEPRNATLFYKLALLRLDQSKPRLAEDLAKKSALLASTDNTLKKHCWLLIAHAREIQQDFAGAKEARAKADSF
jgi:hypothetical protein